MARKKEHAKKRFQSQMLSMRYTMGITLLIKSKFVLDNYIINCIHIHVILLQPKNVDPEIEAENEGLVEDVRDIDEFDIELDWDWLNSETNVFDMDFACNQRKCEQSIGCKNPTQNEGMDRSDDIVAPSVPQFDTAVRKNDVSNKGEDKTEAELVWDFEDDHTSDLMFDPDVLNKDIPPQASEGSHNPQASQGARTEEQDPSLTKEDRILQYLRELQLKLGNIETKIENLEKGLAATNNHIGRLNNCVSK